MESRPVTTGFGGEGGVELGLIDTNGKPQPAFEELVTLSGAQFNAKMKELLTASYGGVFGGIDLKRATGSQVHEAFRKQGVQGSTAVKAIAFFLAAAKEAGIEVSKHVKPPIVATQRRTPQRGNMRPTEDEDDGDEQQDNGGQSSFLPDVHPALAGILMQLPTPGETLSHKDRERFMKAFEAVLTLVYPSEEDDDLLK